MAKMVGFQSEFHRYSVSNFIENGLFILAKPYLTIFMIIYIIIQNYKKDKE